MGILKRMSAGGRPLEVVPETGVLKVHAAPARVRTASLAPHVGAAGVLVTGAVLAVCAAQSNTLVPQTVRPMPGWLAGVFAHTGVSLGPAAVIALLTLMFISYAVAVRGASEISPRMALVSIALLCALFLLAPVILSTDVFSYQAYARMGTVYGTNPYLHGPSTIRLDSVYPFIGAKWVSTPTAYGPLFTALSYPLAHLGISASVAAYKSLAALAFLATVGLVFNGARIRGLDPVRAAIIVGFNPLTVAWGLGGGHNDLLMLAPLVAGMYVLLEKRDATGGVMIALAAAVKLTAGLLLPFALVRPQANRRRLLFATGVASALVAVLAFAMFGTGPFHVLGTLRQNQAAGNWQSVPGIATELGVGDGGRLTGVVLAAVFAGVTLRLLVLVHRGRLDWIAGAGWATVAMLCTASSLLAWYVAWLTPLAALAPDRRLRRWTLAITGVILLINVLIWVPDSSTPAGG